MTIRRLIVGGLALAATLAAVAALPADEPKAQPAKDKAAWKDLFDGKSLAGWKPAAFTDGGKVEARDGAIVMDRGTPMTGVVYAKGDFPTVDYEVAFEAKRVDGDDFFATTVFPVGDAFCSFVLGGWGGNVVGLSNVNYENASENETTTSKEFEHGKWYPVRLRVTTERVKAWIGDEVVVDLETADRKISLHSACSPCKPFGFATWKTTGAVRGVRVRTLTAAEAKEPAGKKDG
jgi:Domain of Unknown Function (DUF1080)